MDKKTTQEVKDAKFWIRRTKSKISYEWDEHEGQNKVNNRKQAILDKEKQKFPYEFPEFQMKDD